MTIATREDAPSRSAAAVGIAVIAGVCAALWWQSTARGPATRSTVAAAAPLRTISPDPPARPKPARAPAVTAFAAFAQESAPAPLPLDHAYTSRGLRLLADALDAAGPPAASHASVLRLREAADALAANRRSTRHADIAREAFMLAAQVIDTLGGERDGTLDEAAKAIDAARPLRTQAGRVARFFSLAAEALNRRGA